MLFVDTSSVVRTRVALLLTKQAAGGTLTRSNAHLLQASVSIVHNYEPYLSKYGLHPRVMQSRSYPIRHGFQGFHHKPSPFVLTQSHFACLYQLFLQIPLELS